MLLDLMNSALPLAQSAVESSGTRVISDEGIENFIPIVAIVMGCTIGIVGIVAGVLSHGQREKTRREIAAYVAEGTISAEDAERMIRAGSAGKCGKN